MTGILAEGLKEQMEQYIGRGSTCINFGHVADRTRRNMGVGGHYQSLRVPFNQAAAQLLQYFTSNRNIPVISFASILL
jgi:hypothetical protein